MHENWVINLQDGLGSDEAQDDVRPAQKARDEQKYLKVRPS